MSAPILATKLYLPPPRSTVVLRSRLIERLNEGLASRCKLTLISAPAGFGKTTLVSEWIGSCGCQVAWLSLDEGDNDPIRFLNYLVAAFQTIAPDIGGMAAAFQPPQPPPFESFLTTLLNEIASIQNNFVFVLDDYHQIDSRLIDQLLTYLLDHMPPQMHVSIATREDPHLPVARYRARGQMTELRADDLRFTSAEAAEFLNRVMGLHLSTEDIAALETRTEGWIAGLQLAAISMHDRQDMGSFIKSFTGSHRFVLDYLVEEVLQQQTEHIRSFLLQTSILDRLCGPLCNVITGQGDGKAMLEALVRSNLFVIPLDDQRRWYRYHHLFGEVLRAFLDEAYSEQVPTLHRKASVWFEQNDLPAEAIRHALAAKDFERAAVLIEEVWLEMDLTFQSAAWLVWAKALPEEVILARPVLCVGCAWAMLAVGEIEASEARLQDAERWLETPSNEMIVMDRELSQSLPATIATARAYRFLALGDVPGAVKYAQQALALTSEDDQVRYTQAISLLGLAQYTSGDLEAAECSLSYFHAKLRKTGEITTLIGINFLLANIRVALGRLHEVESIYQQSLRLATEQGEPMPLGTADLYRGLGELYIERGDLEAAAQHLLTSQKLGERTATTDWPYRLCVSQARLKEVQGDLDGALALLDKAERVYIRAPLPDVRPVAALKARIWIRQGRLTEAFSWAREQNLSPDDDLSYSREFEHLTLARVLIARYKTDQVDGDLHAALGLLARLLQAAEEGGRNGSVIEILIQQSLAYQAQGDQLQALASLERALSLAEPEGYVRVFVDKGEALRLLILDFRFVIEKSARDGVHHLYGYVDKLLSAFAQPMATTPKSRIKNQKSEIVEPLSERELEVLKQLRSELSGPEIAQQLIVSLHTLRTHTNNIYKKLGVNNRRAAIRRAEELALL